MPIPNRPPLLHPRHRRGRARGVTLFEVLIGVALIALMMGAVIAGSGFTGAARLRSDAAMLTSAVRVAAAQANTSGKPARLVFDLEQHSIWLEESSGRFLREKDEGASTGAGAEAATEHEKEAREYAEEILDGPRAKRASFTLVKRYGFSAEGEGKRSLQSGIKFRSIQTDHDGEPRIDGRAYLYFWPGGDTERAAIQMYRADDQDGLTILVHGLTGRAVIKRGRVELEEPREDDEFGDREDD